MRARRALAGAAAALALAVRPSAASAAAPNPASNIPLGPLPAACAGDGGGAICERAAVHALDAARAALGLRAYTLPARFLSMPAGHQWLILADADRLAYGEAPIAGTVAALNAVARQGALAREDPDPWPLLESLHGQRQIAFGSDWAGGQPNALLAYYGWMYDDGYGGGNLDCRTPSAAGCWGHRDNILAFAHGSALAMGVAAPTGARSYALTVVATTTPPWPYLYPRPGQRAAPRRDSVVQVVGQRRDDDAVGARLERRLEQSGALVVEDLVPALGRDDPRDQHGHGRVGRVDRLDVLDDRADDRAVGIDDHLERHAAPPRRPGRQDLAALVLVAGDGDRDDRLAE